MHMVYMLTDGMYVKRLLIVVGVLLIMFACRDTAADVSMKSATEEADCILVQVQVGYEWWM